MIKRWDCDVWGPFEAESPSTVQSNPSIQSFALVMTKSEAIMQSSSHVLASQKIINNSKACYTPT